MTGSDAALLAERDEKIRAHLSARPPWWRVFARRRWKARLAALRAMDVSLMAAMLRQHYTPESVEQMAERASPLASWSCITRAR